MYNRNGSRIGPEVTVRLDPRVFEREYMGIIHDIDEDALASGRVEYRNLPLETTQRIIWSMVDRLQMKYRQNYVLYNELEAIKKVVRRD